MSTEKIEKIVQEIVGLLIVEKATYNEAKRILDEAKNFLMQSTTPSLVQFTEFK